MMRLAPAQVWEMHPEDLVTVIDVLAERARRR
jgi:hypothetical protein